MSTASLYTLPVEIIYHILSLLDVPTILLSVRNICKRFHTIVNSYNRYELDLSSISKIDFHRICRIIPVENVVSITLSDNEKTPGQIYLFISLFNIAQFVQLRSLTLIQIEKSELKVIMEHINLKSLKALSINIRQSNSNSTDTSIIPLVSKIAEANLYKLDLSTWAHEINDIIWPQQCTIQCLTIGRFITIKQIYMILSRLSHLRVLILKNCILHDTDEIIMTFSDVETNIHLTSLTFNDSRLQMEQLEFLLSLTPSLVHLQLTGSVNSLDEILNGSRWESFIQTKLLSLQKFEFFFRTKINTSFNSTTIESWIASFRTAFWLKEKSWFVTSNYLSKTETFRLYSLPVCDPCITYESDFDKSVCTTCSTVDNNVSIMNNVREVHLNLTSIMATVNAKKVIPEDHHLFSEVTGLTLTVNGEWPLGSNEYLSTLINLSCLTTLELYVECDHCLASNTISHIGYLLAKAYNVRSVTLSNSLFHSNLNGIVENFCSIIPHYIKHLDIYDMDLDDIKILLQRLQHLTSISFIFCCDMPFNPTEIITWLSQRRYFTYLVDKNSLSLWLGQHIKIRSQFSVTTVTSV